MQSDEALADYSRAAEIEPDLFHAFNNRGALLFNLGYHEQALADYSRAIQIEPIRSDALYTRGDLYILLERYEEALADYRRIVELEPEHDDALNKIGIILAEMGQVTEALTHFEDAARLGHADAAANATKARQLLHMAMEPEVDTRELAFDAFQEANSLDEMREAVKRFPILTDEAFMSFIEEAIEEQVPLDYLSASMQQLRWLWIIADEQT